MNPILKTILEDRKIDELFFVSCPTEEQEPFYWRWTEEGKKVIQSHITLSHIKILEAAIELVDSFITSPPKGFALDDGVEAERYARNEAYSKISDILEDVIQEIKKEK